MTDKKPDLTLWTFKFVVQAANWEDAAKILKDTLNIEATHDSSDREINGLYLITSLINDKKLTKKFYSNIASSEDISIHSDAKSNSLYPEILKEAQAVEENIRWLLLHVSDAIDNFADQFSKKKDPQKKSEIITAKSLDPITSTLTFEAMIGLLKLDQSWRRDGVTIDQMRELMDTSSDFADFKKSYVEKTTKMTIWDSISDLVLQKSTKWEEIEDKLNKIRGYRNLCAHFRTVTDDDLSKAQYLRKDLDLLLARKKVVTKSDLASLHTLNEQLARALKTISQSYMSNINTSALTALSSQIDTLKLSHGMQQIVQQSLPSDAILRATANMIPRFDIPSPSQALIDSINSSIGSMNGLHGDSEEDNINSDDNTSESADDIKEPDSDSDDEEKK